MATSSSVRRLDAAGAAYFAKHCGPIHYPRPSPLSGSVATTTYAVRKRKVQTNTSQSLEDTECFVLLSDISNHVSIANGSVNVVEETPEKQTSDGDFVSPSPPPRSSRKVACNAAVRSSDSHLTDLDQPRFVSTDLSEPANTYLLTSDTSQLVSLTKKTTVTAVNTDIAASQDSSAMPQSSNSSSVLSPTLLSSSELLTSSGEGVSTSAPTTSQPAMVSEAAKHLFKDLYETETVTPDWSHPLITLDLSRTVAEIAMNSTPSSISQIFSSMTSRGYSQNPSSLVVLAGDSATQSLPSSIEPTQSQGDLFSTEQLDLIYSVWR